MKRHGFLLLRCFGVFLLLWSLGLGLSAYANPENDKTGEILDQFKTHPEIMEDVTMHPPGFEEPIHFDEVRGFSFKHTFQCMEYEKISEMGDRSKSKKPKWYLFSYGPHLWTEEGEEAFVVNEGASFSGLTCKITDDTRPVKNIEGREIDFRHIRCKNENVPLDRTFWFAPRTVKLSVGYAPKDNEGSSDEFRFKPMWVFDGYTTHWWTEKNLRCSQSAEPEEEDGTEESSP